MEDPDIKDMIKRYPMLNCTNVNKTLRQVPEDLLLTRKSYQKRTLEKILKNIEKVET
jgi:hypothetical protein